MLNNRENCQLLRMIGYAKQPGKLNLKVRLKCINNKINMYKQVLLQEFVCLWLTVPQGTLPVHKISSN